VSGLSVMELYGAWQAARYQDGIPARSA
jgi:hypothetical protein